MKKMKNAYVVAMLAGLCSSSLVVYATLNDTGQTSCHDGTRLGACVDPPGAKAPYQGQDGNYGRDAEALSGQLVKTGAGVAGFDFTPLDAAGDPIALENGLPAAMPACVRDNVTGLVWDAGNTEAMDAKQAAQYAGDFSAEGWCGLTDWRLPNLQELQGLVDAGAVNPAVDGEFLPGVVSGTVWSSTRNAKDPNQAWVVDFTHGTSSTRALASTAGVRFVSGTTIVADFEAVDADTITQHDSGLMWAKCSLGQTGSSCAGIVTMLDWSEALQAAQSARIAGLFGYDDWRLPNKKELEGLVDDTSSGLAISAAFFPNTVPANYWTSTAAQGVGNAAWAVDMRTGGSQEIGMTMRSAVRLVRDVMQDKMAPTDKAVPWSTTVTMANARYAHTATKLADGTVLVVGGRSSTAALATVELYNPTANTWTTKAALSGVRSHHTATLLDDGKVLVVGGEDSAGAGLKTALLYDLAANAWTSTGSLTGARSKHTATKLANGKVLVAGGLYAGTSVATVQVYDPTAGSWGAEFAMAQTQGRYSHVAALTASGVLVAGGEYNDGDTVSKLATAELCTATACTTAAAMSSSRLEAAAVALADGTVLVAGGRNSSGSLATAELFTLPNTWSAAGSMATAVSGHTATLLSSGKVLVAGGYSGTASVNNANLYDATANAWTATGALATVRKGHAAVLLTNGKVLVTGGVNGTTAIAGTELYDPTLAAPTAVTGDASDLTLVGGKLNGTVTANGLATTVTFDLGADTNYGTSIAATPASIAATVTAATAVSATRTGLICGTTYHYRVKAVNTMGTTYGVDKTLTTSACVDPVIANTAATSITGTGAQLNANINGKGAITTVTFEWGTTTSYGGATVAPVPASIAAGLDANTAVRATLTGLTCNTSYHYRFNADNSASANPVNGADGTFKTAGCAPTAVTAAATSTSLVATTFKGTVTANGAATTVSFEFGTTTAYGTNITATPASIPATTTAATAVSATRTGLTCGTEYHYRVKAINSAGTTLGSDMTVTTSACVDPVIANTAATSITGTGAQLNANINGKGAITTVTFEWGEIIEDYWKNHLRYYFHNG